MGNKPSKGKGKLKLPNQKAKPLDPTQELEDTLKKANVVKKVSNTSTLLKPKPSPKPSPKPENGTVLPEERQQIIQTITNGLPQQPAGHQQTLPSLSGLDSNDNSIVIAMYNYRAQNKGDLSFMKGEKLEVVEKSDPDWWTVKRLETGEIGYIPANYVGSTAIESEE